MVCQACPAPAAGPVLRLSAATRNETAHPILGPRTPPTGRKVWLSERTPVFAQGVDSTSTLFFMHKYWFLTIDEINDIEAAAIIYGEVRT